ncbi:hypothetical protein C6P98_22555 [Burkholderia multivorans]|uniref:Uncharacterized protein n=1 Tax=Burkholderia multivorans TaxID=87883 RepID=A0A8E2RSK0_9BURK|nr:hypothetical protein C6P98_22555 [Burkholderia multivorans]
MQVRGSRRGPRVRLRTTIRGVIDDGGAAIRPRQGEVMAQFSVAHDSAYPAQEGGEGGGPALPGGYSERLYNEDLVHRRKPWRV